MLEGMITTELLKVSGGVLEKRGITVTFLYFTCNFYCNCNQL